jgi:hypothetical protein
MPRFTKPLRTMKWRIQRARRGWSERDVWELHCYLASVIAGTVEHLRDHGMGYDPSMTEEEWRDTLTRIVDPLKVDLNRHVEGETYSQAIEREKAERAAIDEALKLFVEHFWALWD